jgi:hypothetical protein
MMEPVLDGRLKLVLAATEKLLVQRVRTGRSSDLQKLFLAAS